jgi:hypothetical protein
MQASGWLPLNEYSNKYNVSTSTLRRRIRSNEIEFQFRDGKYWLKDVETARGYKSTTPIYSQSVASTRSASEVADKLVTELKGAYVLILQEKEEMILQLKEEVADLKTLVRILESENERLRSSSAHALPDVGQWLEEPLEP